MLLVSYSNAFEYVRNINMFILNNLSRSLMNMAGELGLEPRLAESESAVLPLDDSPNKI